MTSAQRRPICASLAAACPLLLLLLVFVLSTPRGTHLYDRIAGTYGTALVAFGVLILVIVALLASGLALAVASLLRREKPAWIAVSALVVNGLIAAAGLVRFM